MTAETGASITWWAVVSAFGGTIIGSVLGGIISFLLQRKALASNKALHDADRKEVRKAIGYAIFFKMIRTCSDLAQLGKLVTQSIDEAKRRGHTGELWPSVVPIVHRNVAVSAVATQSLLIDRCRRAKRLAVPGRFG